MTALEGMNEVLDINEMVEWLKSNNVESTPNQEFCKLTELLTNYRTLLAAVMDQTNLYSMDK